MIKIIPEYKLPNSSHAGFGIAIYLLIATISFVVYVNTGWSGYVIFPLAMVLSLTNAAYWFNVDENRYIQYKNYYVQQLTQSDVATIKQKISECGFGTRTERFLTSYLKRYHADALEKCQNEIFNFFTCDENKNP